MSPPAPAAALALLSLLEPRAGCPALADAASLVQQALSPRRPRGKTSRAADDWESLASAHWSWGSNVTQAQMQAVRAALKAEMAKLEDHDARTQFRSAYRDFERVARTRGYTALALKETWTELDTELMHAWYGPDYDTNETIRRLPSIRELPFWGQANSSTAVMVGNGMCVRGKKRGKWIDSHSAVARFNQYSEDRRDWGSRITQHVANKAVDRCCDELVPLVDLEIIVHEGKKVWDRRFPEHPRAPVFFVRPARLQAAPRQATRGLLYFLLLGRYYPRLDLIGFSGQTDLSAGDGLLHEAGRLFEHSLWRALHAQGLVNLVDEPEEVEARQVQLRASVAGLAAKEGMLVGEDAEERAWQVAAAGQEQ